MRKRIIDHNRILSRAGLFLGAPVLILLGALTFAGTAGAAESDKAKAKTNADESVPCPYLIEARYPFLECKKDAWGSIVLDAPVQEITGLRIPKMDSFVDGPGYWGS
ncbi:MAG: hypothetical protein VX252_16975 [Myxococcota bacterium]|nr:hypothetical protein [Myxococcota bacterium]